MVMQISEHNFLSPQSAIVCIPLLLLVWAFNATLRRKSPVEHLPLPSEEELIWGHERLVYTHEPGTVFRKWTSELGLTYRIKAAFGAKDVLVISDPVAIAYILQKKIYDYHHSAVVRPRIARLLGKGLGWVEGEAEHKRMRHLVSPSLSAENVKGMSGDIGVAASQVIDDFVSHVQSRKDSDIVNMLDWMAKATLNVIGRVAFLHDFEGGKSQHAEEILSARRRGVSPAIQYAGFITLMLLRRFHVLNKLPIGAIQSQGLAKRAVQSGVAHELVQRNSSLVGASIQKDLLSRLLAAHAAGRLSKEELYEQISTFIISGHETTTLALSFTIYELSRHPEVQDRLRKEIITFPGEPTYDDFQNRLPYLDAVLKETLRLYPALPYMERIATKDDSIPLHSPVTLDNGQTTSQLPVSPGQVVLIPIIALHRMDSVWKNPDTFRPERWLEDLPPSELLSSGWANLLAFSDGPRNCVGYRLAIFQYKVILSTLLGKLNFRDAGENVTLKIASSLQPWVVGRPELGPWLPVHVELL